MEAIGLRVPEDCHVPRMGRFVLRDNLIGFFLAWHWNWGLGRNRNTKQLLEHPWVINREDIPPGFAAGAK